MKKKAVDDKVVEKLVYDESGTRKDSLEARVL